MEKIWASFFFCFEIFLAHFVAGDFDDIGTEQETKLGQIIAEKYGIDFYWVDQYDVFCVVQDSLVLFHDFISGIRPTFVRFTRCRIPRMKDTATATIGLFVVGKSQVELREFTSLKC
jgi:hypothetical protein